MSQFSPQPHLEHDLHEKVFPVPYLKHDLKEAVFPLPHTEHDFYVEGNPLLSLTSSQH